MGIQICGLAKNDMQAVYDLLQQNGWSHRFTSLEQLEKLVFASQCNFIAVKNGQVVSYVRAITDGISNGYLSMLIVKSEYLKQGIGQMLVSRTIDTAPQVAWVLRAGRDGAKEFFEKVGFQMSSIAMEWNRKL